MADVFVSYVSEDRAIAEQISRGLEEAGFSVWWDRHLRGGVDFTDEIERQLITARIVVVLWSNLSLKSKFVRDEAQQARDENKLIPVRLDEVQPPLGFRQAQVLDFAGWNGDPKAGAFAGLIDSARHFLGDAAPSAPAAVTISDRPTPQRSKPSKTTKQFVAMAVIVAILASVVAVVLSRGGASRSVAGELTNGRVEISLFDVLRKDEDTARFAAGVRDALKHALATNGIKSVATGGSGSPGAGDLSSGAELLIRGNVDRVQDTFKISADLVRRPEGLLLWSASAQGQADEVDAVQQRFSISVSQTLQCALGLRTLAHDDPSTDLLTKFIQYCAVFQGYGQMSQLEGLANQIIEMAPQHAISHATQAVAAANLTNVPAVGSIALKPEEEQARLRKLADESAAAALQLEPTNKRVEAVVDWALTAKRVDSDNISENMRLIQKSLAADPQYGLARNRYAQLLSSLGRIDESRTEFERAAGLMPLEQQPAVQIAILTAAFGNAVDGRAQLLDFGSRGGNVSENLFWLEYWYGDPQAAKAYIQSGNIAGFLLPGYSGSVPKCLDALLDARIKHTPLPRAQFDAVCAHATPEFPAAFEAERGDIDAAYRELETWAGWYGHNWFVLQGLFMPYMRSVRADPRFMTFAASLGLVEYWLESGHWPDFCANEKLPYDCKEVALAARATKRVK